MELQSDFSKMQCLLTGNRFSGANLHKTRYDFDVRPSARIKGISITVILAVTVEYLEVEDSVKYLQHATFDIPETVLNINNPLQFLKETVTQIQNELIRRYETSQVFKFLELKNGPDRLSEQQLTERLNRIISDYRKGNR